MTQTPFLRYSLKIFNNINIGKMSNYPHFFQEEIITHGVTCKPNLSYSTHYAKLQTTLNVNIPKTQSLRTEICLLVQCSWFISAIT